MRDKVRTAHPVKAGRFDVKHSPGGMVDVEFAVQFLILSQAANHDTLAANSGNIALLHRAQEAGLLPKEVADAAARAYRALRRVQTHLAGAGGVKNRGAVVAAELQQGCGQCSAPHTHDARSHCAGKIRISHPVDRLVWQSHPAWRGYAAA